MGLNVKLVFFGILNVVITAESLVLFNVNHCTLNVKLNVVKRYVTC